MKSLSLCLALSVTVCLFALGLAQQTSTTSTRKPRTTTTMTTTVAPKGCCIADKLEIKAVVTTVESKWWRRTQTKMAVLPQVALDFSQKKLAIREMLASYKGFLNVSTIMDFAKQRAYFSTDGWAHCRTVALPSSTMRGQCMPDDAYLAGEYTLGGGSGALECQEYVVMRRDRRRHEAMAVSQVVQKGQCVPVEEVVAAWKDWNKILEFVNYFDYSAGISDPSVFDVPASCQSAMKSDESELSEVANAMLRSFSV